MGQLKGSWLPSTYPKLTDSSSGITSEATDDYNCIAWAAGEDFRWWEPDLTGNYYWPEGVERTATLEAYVAAYETLGFSRCENGELEAGIEKIALFGSGSNGDEKPTHAARQLECGKWSSKLGQCEDITHTEVEDVSCVTY